MWNRDWNYVLECPPFCSFWICALARNGCKMRGSNHRTAVYVLDWTFTKTRLNRSLDVLRGHEISSLTLGVFFDGREISSLTLGVFYDVH